MQDRKVRQGMPRWMRALMVVVPLALITVLAAAACEEEPPPASSPGQPVAGARISVDKDAFDFGQVPLDKEVRTTFNVKNVGSDTLTLRDVRIRLVEGC